MLNLFQYLLKISGLRVKRAMTWCKLNCRDFVVQKPYFYLIQKQNNEVENKILFVEIATC